MKLNYYSAFLGFTLIFTLTACSLTPSNFDNKLQWLVGNWSSNYTTIVAEENWTWNESENQYEANGSMINLKDTIYNQTMKIHQEEDELFLSVKTYDNKTQKEAFFKLIRYDADSLVFKNIFQRNPRYIIYSNGDTTLNTQAIVEKDGLTQIDSRKYKKKQ